MKKTMNKPVLRCRICYQELTGPTCDRCRETREKTVSILNAANQISRTRGTYLEGGRNPFEKVAEIGVKKSTKKPKV